MSNRLDGPLILGTANRHKALEFEMLLAGSGLELGTLAGFAHALAIEESGRTLAENARVKACRQARHLGRWVLADDTGLLVDALDGAPGLRSARFAGPQADAAANRQLLLEKLAHVPWPARQARFVCALALADPSGTVRAESEGACCGRIRISPAGSQSFGYDCLFEILEYHRTLAELGAAAQARLSHRARAVGRILPQLLQLAGRAGSDAL